MRALVLSCTLKPSPAASNTEALARVVMDALESEEVTTELVRVVDHDVKPGVENDTGDGDAWPGIRAKVLAAEILVMAARPGWDGRRAWRSGCSSAWTPCCPTPTTRAARSPTTAWPAWW
jgi:multimeric flavodoxin WrbA